MAYLQVVHFAFSILAGAVCSWTTKQCALKQGVTCHIFSESSHVARVLDCDWSEYLLPLECLPAYVSNLTKEPWAQILVKVSICAIYRFPCITTLQMIQHLQKTISSNIKKSSENIRACTFWQMPIINVT